MAIQIRRGTNAEWESNKSNIVVGEPAIATDEGRFFIGTGTGTYAEMSNIENLAEAFDSSATYAVGDYCTYGGKLYKFTTAHSGAWNASHVDEVALADALDALGDGVYTKAEADALLLLKADKSDTYTKTEVNTALALKADKSTTYTKTEVDNLVPSPSDATPLMDGTASAGVSGDYSRADHVHPTATTLVPVDLGKYATHNYFVNLSNKWSGSGKSKNIPVSDFGNSTLIVTANSETESAIVCFLKSVSSSGSADFATGTGRIVISTGETQTLSIPSDCNYVNILTLSSNGTVNRIPSEVKTYKRISEIIDDKLDVSKNNDRNIMFPNAELNAEIVGFICYGQSWSMGYDTLAIPAFQRYDNIMLDCGLMNNPASSLPISATEFVPLVEATVNSSGSGTQKCGETPCTAQTDIIKQLLASENGIGDSDVKYQIFSAAPGMGSKSIEQLSKGTDFYTRLIDVVTTANNLARAENKVFVVPAISWTQGESSGNDPTYYDLLETLRLDLDADIKAITGQTIPVKLIAWQAVTDASPKRAYDRYVYASEKYENIICSGTYYQFNHIASNNLHLTPSSQDWLGSQLGIAFKRSIVDGEKFIPLKPKKAEVFGNIVYLDFYVPVKPIAFDTTLVAENTNYGFQIFDSNNTEKTISSVEIIAPDKIKIVCVDNVASTDHIVYGGNGGSAYSPTTGRRGNLRDSQEIIYQNHAAENLPCYNWCVVFDKTIVELQSE